MTTTRIDHTGHNHPKTTAARTACRKAMKNAAPAVTLYPVATVGKGNALHLALLDNGTVYAVRCGAGLGRGVRKNSPIVRREDSPMADVTCRGCTSRHGLAHN